MGMLTVLPDAAPSLSLPAAITAVVEAQGNLALAAERLHTTLDLLSALLYDPITSSHTYTTIREAIRIRLMLQVYEAATTAYEALLTAQDEATLSTKDAATHYLRLLERLTTLIEEPSPQVSITNNNNMQALYANLPPDVQEAIAVVMRSAKE